MSTLERAVRVLGAALFSGLALTAAAQTATAESATPRLGQPIRASDAARYDLNVFPDGSGLPAGRGTAVEGAALFSAQCAACHGPGGRGASAEELAGATEPLTSPTPDKTIGTYWPYATTLFDFIRRAKPMTSPGSLSADQVYALTAYLLYANGLVPQQASIDAKSLPRVRMPNRDGFIGIDAPSSR